MATMIMTIRRSAAMAGLCLLARWRGWILPDADAWSPMARVSRHVSRRYRDRRRRRLLKDGRHESQE